MQMGKLESGRGEMLPGYTQGFKGKVVFSSWFFQMFRKKYHEVAFSDA